ncbi:MAG: hydroxypyruvate isomerase [Verrucomicrobia bacterium]|nr:MAG: hydroxypyruvate isomerase [Verrucomicrobiota bacterium]TAF27320.1 MAG: hydroxypyruvate isomerase [Verrucomicrobiota bacterium]TAF42389.1 MAG: hydroxypyruvate isomerase [Verrucomicrobiota bacterium]
MQIPRAIGGGFRFSFGMSNLPGCTPNTPIAVNIEMWFEGGFEERIEQAAALGFPAIELWTWRDKDLAAGAAALRRHGMIATQFTAWGFGKQINDPAFPAEDFVEEIAAACAAAALLPGCERFCVVAGDNIEGLTKEQMHASVVAKLRAAVPVLEAHRKMIILEPMNPYNHPNHCLYGSADGIEICRAVDSPWVRLNWDLFHMQRFEGNLIDHLERHREWIGYIQFADSPARHEPGTGEIRFSEIFRKIRELALPLPLGAECIPQDQDARRAAERLQAAVAASE